MGGDGRLLARRPPAEGCLRRCGRREGRRLAAAIRQGDAWWLDDLWIEPAWMGKGIGSGLFRHAAEQGRQTGAARMEWEAEPNALGFYEKMGGRYVRDGEPSVWGRVNAVMGLDLS